jgi:hypothetical protein
VRKKYPDWKSICLFLIHPHICRENLEQIDTEYAEQDIPPQVWGSSHIPTREFAQYRYTPTYVGKMNPYDGMADAGEIHPHVCGEDLYLYRYCGQKKIHPHRCEEKSRDKKPINLGEDTPPLVWGRFLPMPKNSNRYTPTHVGKRT